MECSECKGNGRIKIKDYNLLHNKFPIICSFKDPEVIKEIEKLPEILVICQECAGMGFIEE